MHIQLYAWLTSFMKCQEMNDTGRRKYVELLNGWTASYCAVAIYDDYDFDWVDLIRQSEKLKWRELITEYLSQIKCQFHEFV